MAKNTPENLQIKGYLSQFVDLNRSSFESKYADLNEILHLQSQESIPESFQDRNYLLLSESEQYELAQQIYNLNSDIEIFDVFGDYLDLEKKVASGLTRSSKSKKRVL